MNNSLTVECDVYSNLSDKAKEVVPQVEKLLSGLTYNEVEQMYLAVMQKIRAISLVVL